MKVVLAIVLFVVWFVAYWAAVFAVGTAQLGGKGLAWLDQSGFTLLAIFVGSYALVAWLIFRRRLR